MESFLECIHQTNRHEWQTAFKGYHWYCVEKRKYYSFWNNIFWMLVWWQCLGWHPQYDQCCLFWISGYWSSSIDSGSSLSWRLSVANQKADRISLPLRGTYCSVFSHQKHFLNFISLLSIFFSSSEKLKTIVKMKLPNVEMTCEKNTLTAKNIWEGRDVKNNKVHLSSSLRAFINW